MWAKLASIVKARYTHTEVIYVCEICGEVIVRRKHGEKVTGASLLAEIYRHFKKAHPDILKKVAEETGIGLKTLVKELNKLMLGKVGADWITYASIIYKKLKIVKEYPETYVCEVCGKVIAEKKNVKNIAHLYSAIWKHFKENHIDILLKIREQLQGRA